MTGRSPDGSGHSAEPEPISDVSAETASVPNAKREPNIVCPHCGEGLFVEAAGVVGADQRMSVTIHPRSGEGMVQAEALCGQVSDLDKIMQSIAKQDGGKIRTYVEHIGMTEDGGFKFDLAVLPIRNKAKQAKLPLASAIEARSDATTKIDAAEGESAGPKDDAHA